MATKSTISRLANDGATILMLMLGLALASIPQGMAATSPHPLITSLIGFLTLLMFAIAQNIWANKSLGKPAPTPWTTAGIVTLLVLGFAWGLYMVLATLKMLPEISGQSNNIGILTLETYPRSVLFFSVLNQVLLIPYIEEVMFRRVLTTLCSTNTDERPNWLNHSWVNYLLAFVLFALAEQGLPMSGSKLMTFVLCGLLSIILTFVYKRTSKLIYPLGLHAAVALFFAIPAIIVLL